MRARSKAASPLRSFVYVSGDNETVLSRAEVANTIGYRRRKGTLLALEQVPIDVSGRAGRRRRGVPAADHHREHAARADPATTPPSTLRGGRALDRLGTAFDVTQPHDRRAPHRAADPRASPTPTPRRSTSRCTARAAPTSPTSRSTCGGGKSWRGHRRARVRGRRRAVHVQPAWPRHAAVLGPPARAASRPDDRAGRPAADRPRRASPASTAQAGIVLLTADGAAVDASQIYGANLADRPGGSWCAVPPA